MKRDKSKLKLIECEPERAKPVVELDEVALLIRSINNMGKKAKNKNSQEPEPEPPKAA